MAQIQFNAANVAPAEPITPLADGWYPAMITESDIKPTATGSGLRMPLTFSICEGHPYANRKVFEGLNIQNQNPVAQAIAQEQLSAICHAVDQIQVNDTQELHGKPLLIKLSTTARREDTVTGKVYEPKNEIKGYAKIGTQEVNMTPKPTAGAAATPTQPAWANQAAPVTAPVQQPVAQAPAPQQAAPATPAPATGNAWEQQAPGVPAAAPAAAAPAAAPAPAADVPAWAQAGQG